MSSIFEQNPQPIHILKRSGQYDNPFVDIEEKISMKTNRVILKEIPNRFNKVFVRSENMYFQEKNMISEVVNETDFYVDYQYGICTFHESVINKHLTFSYKGEGFIMLSADRVYFKDGDGEVKNTLQGLVDETVSLIQENREIIAEQVQQINQKIIELESAKQGTISATNNANNAVIQVQNAISDLSNMILQNKKIYKPFVNTYVDIQTTYPSPSIGWVTTTKDTGTTYRFDGVTWIAISAKETFDGFNVYVGASPPDNDNLMWVDASSNDEGAMGRIIASKEEPEQDNYIWWITD